MTLLAAALFLTQTKAPLKIAGTYPLYASVMTGTTYSNVPAGRLTLRPDSNYSLSGATEKGRSSSGRYVQSGSTLRFSSGPYAGGTATFKNFSGRLRINITAPTPDAPRRKLRLFGNRNP